MELNCFSLHRGEESQLNQTGQDLHVYPLPTI